MTVLQLFLRIRDALRRKYVICIAALIGCIVYGYLNWNKDSDDDGREY